MNAETATRRLIEMSYNEWRSLDDQGREALARAAAQDARAAASTLYKSKEDLIAAMDERTFT